MGTWAKLPQTFYTIDRPTGLYFHSQTKPKAEHLSKIPTDKLYRRKSTWGPNFTDKLYRRQSTRDPYFIDKLYQRHSTWAQLSQITMLNREQLDQIFKNNLYRRQSTWFQLSQTNYTIDNAPGHELDQLSRKNSASAQNSHIKTISNTEHCTVTAI